MRDPATGKWLPGESGNPAGRPVGSVGVATLIQQSHKRLAKDSSKQIIAMCAELGLDPETTTVAQVLIEAGNIHALKGDSSWWDKFVQRADGPVVQVVSQETDIVVRFADGEDTVPPAPGADAVAPE